MSKRILLTAILVLFLSFINSLSVSAEINLTCSDVGTALSMASAYDLPTFDEPFNAEYCGSEAWYRFDLVAGESVTATITSHLGAGYLRLALRDGYNNQYRLTGYAYDGQTKNFEFYPAVAGTYYLRVIGRDGAYGNYDLAVYRSWYNAGVSDTDRSYYSTYTTARYLTADTYAISGQGSEYYRFAAQAGETISISGTAHVGVGYLRLHLRDRYHNQYALSGYITNGQTMTVTYTPVVSGVYHLIVSSHDGAHGNYDLVLNAGVEAETDADGDGLNDAVEYLRGTDITLTDTDGDGLTDYEELEAGLRPNFAGQLLTCADVGSAVSMASAYDLPAVDEPFNAEYCGSDAWYRFDLVAGEAITATIKSYLGTGYLRMALRDANNNEYQLTGYAYSGQTKNFEFYPAVAGTYYLRVIGRDGAYGNYDLAVYRSWYNAGVSDTDRSYYSTYTTARYLTAGTYAISGQGSEYYRFAAQAGETISISGTAHVGVGYLRLHLRDRHHNQYALSGYISNGKTMTVTHTPVVSGVYHLIVSSHDGAHGNYDLVLNAGVEAETDTDGDGLNDAVEYLRGTDISLTDTDGDGLSDYVELAQGSDPLIVLEYPSSVTETAVGMASAIAVPGLDIPFGSEFPGTDTWYSVDLVAGQGITVALTAHLNAGCLDFHVYNSDGVEIAGSGDSNITDGQIRPVSFTAFESGTYYIRVRRSCTEAVGRYDLAVYNAWYNAGVVDSQRDYTGTFETAHYIHSGRYSASSLDKADDYYRFAARAGTQIDVSVTAHLSTGGIDFRVYSAQGSQIAASHDGTLTDGQTGTATIAGAVIEDSVYYVRVHQDSSTPRGTYDLVITGAEADVDTDADGLLDSAEHHRGTDVDAVDSDLDGLSDYEELAQGSDPLIVLEYPSSVTETAVGMASAIAVPGLDIPFGSEFPGTDTWYSVDLVAGQGITVALTAHLNAGCLDFHVHNPDGVQIGGSGDSNITDGKIRPVSFTAFESGTYYIRVRRSCTEAVGRYDLAVYNAWYNAGVVDSQRDYTGTFETAHYIHSGRYSASSLDKADDYYRFAARAGTQIDVSVTAHLGTGGVDFKVYSAHGSRIAASHDSTLTDGQTGTATIAGAIIEDGVYYVRVHQDSSTPRGTYDLVITGAEADVDTDADGLLDSAEHHRGTDVDSVDSDGDGLTDYQELERGSDPLIVLEYPSSVTETAVGMASAIAVPGLDIPFGSEFPGTDTWYSVDLVAGQGITVALTAHLNAGCLDFHVHNPDGVQIGGSGDSNITNDEIRPLSFTVFETGTYYLRVRRSCTYAVGRYDLAVYNAWYNAGVVDSQRNYTGTFETAHYIHSGRYSARSLDKADDYYRFAARAGTQIDVSVTAHLGTGGVDFKVYSAHGSRIAASHDGTLTDGQTGTATIAGAVIEDSVYYVRVHQDSSTPRGTYDLVITGAEVEVDTDLEGLYDAAEYHHGTAVDQSDTDQDGISDYDELSIGTDPLLPGNLLAHWNFDEGSGTAVYDVIGDHDGFLIGGTWTVDGKINSGLIFSSDDYVDIGSLDLVGSWSIEAWFQYPLPMTSTWNSLCKGSSDHLPIIVQRSSMLLGTYENNGGGFRSSGYDMSGLSAGWHHVVAVGQYSSTHFYIDGRYVGTAPFKSDTDIRSIGNNWHGGQQFGTVDEVKVYDTALTDTEILERYTEYEAGINKIIADDASAGGPGLQSGDRVIVYFSTATNAPLIDSTNIDEVLQLPGHSWKDGSGDIGGAAWDTTYELNDTLIITLSSYNGDPSVSIGDSVTLDAITIQTLDGRPIVSSKIISDSVFDIHNNFCDTSPFKLNGSVASINTGDPIYFNDSCVLRLTNDAWQAGSAFLQQKVALINPATLQPDGSFSTYFEFQVGDSQGIADEDGLGGDGLVFVVQAKNDSALGTYGGYIGYSGISPSLGIEFDTYNNGSMDGGSGNHVGINLNGNLNSVARTTIPVRINNGEIWHAWVEYDSITGVMEVRLSQIGERPAAPVLTYSLDLLSLLGTTEAYIGFTSGTGRAHADHDVRQWQFYNRFARDIDGDGIPDSWEDANDLNSNDPFDAQGDPDDDKLNNFEEYTERTNPISSDTDSDGMPDGWEVDNGLNPLQNDAALDADGDGLTNAQEYKYLTDPQNEDTDGDGFSDSEEVAAGTNPRALTSLLTADADDIVLSLGASRKVGLTIANNNTTVDTFQLSVAGPDDAWYTLEQETVILSAGEQRTIPLLIHIPDDCGIAQTEANIHIAAVSSETGPVANGGAYLHVQVKKAPVVTDVYPLDQEIVGSNSIQISWQTDTESTPQVHYRIAGSENFSIIEGPPGNSHRFVLDNLQWDTIYEWYSVSIGACETVQTQPRTFEIQDGVVFEDAGSTHQILRDYDQPITVGVTNRDVVSHDVRVQVVNSYEDFITGFVGSGSQDEILELSPGETADLTLVNHAQDSQNDQYILTLKLIADEDSTNPIVDYARVSIDVKDPVFSLQFTETSQKPEIFTNTYQITNRGDTITDLRVFADESIAPQITFQPSIEHFKLDHGASVIFQVTFHPESGVSQYDGQLTAEGAGQQVSLDTGFGCESGLSLYDTTLYNKHICRKAEAWYCTNRPVIKVNLDAPKGIAKENITRARIYSYFSLPWPKRTYRDHDVIIKFNGEVVDRKNGIIPAGPYAVEINPELIQTGSNSRGRNQLKIESHHMNGGHYVVATDFQMILDVDQIDSGPVCATSQAEADALAEDFPYLCSGEPAWQLCPKIDAIKPITEEDFLRWNFDPGEEVQLHIATSNPDLDPHNTNLNVTIDDDPNAGGVLFEDNISATLQPGGSTSAHFTWTIPDSGYAEQYELKAVITGDDGCVSDPIVSTLAVNKPVAGRVTDNETGAGLGGAEVCAFGFGQMAVYVDCAETNAQGEYTLNLPDGKYAFFATKNGFSLDSWIGSSTAGGPTLILSHDSGTLGKAPDSGHAQDPVTTALGNFTLEAADLTLKGRGLNIAFNRYYNSQDPYNGPLGYGWTHNYNITLTHSDEVTIVKYGDGHEEFYVRQTDGSYTSQPGVFATLAEASDGTFTLEDKRQTVHRFDAGGRLLEIIDRNGNAVVFTYTGDLLKTVTDPVGRQVQFTYDANGRITELTDPISRTIRFAYDAAGNLVSAFDAMGQETVYTYDAMHQILTATDPNGNVFVTNTYDNQKRVVTAQSDALGNVSRFEYDERNHVTTITDPLGNQTVHRHDNRNRLLEVIDPLRQTTTKAYDDDNNVTATTDKRGNVTRFEYDARGNVTRIVDALGNETFIAYDQRNNPTSKTDAVGNVTSFAYDASGNLVSTTDALGNVTTVAVNAFGQPESVTDPLGNVTSFAYDAEGNLTAVTDALGNVVTHAYDGAGRRTATTDALGNTTSFTLDANDQLTAVTDPAPFSYTVGHSYDANGNRTGTTDRRGNTTTMAYDAKDRLTAVTDAMGSTVSYQYDALDRRTAVTDQRGNTTQMTYDPLGRLEVRTDALGGRTRNVYDADDNLIRRTDPSGRSIDYTYDALNRKTAQQDALGNRTEFAYDALGRMTSKTDALGRVTSYAYDALGRLVQVTEPGGAITQYTYDANGNKTGFTDANGNIFSYNYDALNRLETDADGVQYTYDPAGNLIGRTDAEGVQLQFSYDALNRLVEKRYPDSRVVAYGYDAAGNLVQMTDGLGTTSRQYDELNRLTASTDPKGQQVQMAYDAAGNRTGLIYPDSLAVTYTYDALNRLSEVTDWASRSTSYSYDAAGNLLSVAYPHGAAADMSYDQAARLVSMVNQSPSSEIISNYAYTLDSTGNRTRVEKEEPLIPFVRTQSITYQYDADNRLVSMTDGSFTYNANGSVTGKTVGGVDYTYTWNEDNRLTGLTTGQGTSAFVYDGLNNRLAATRNGVTTRYVLDPAGGLPNVICETDTNGAITSRYIYGLGLIAKEDAAGIHYYHFDPRGSTIAITDAAGQVTDAYAYDAFGNLANRLGYLENPFTYVGQFGLMDEGDGHYFVRARYYDSELGRFLSKDQYLGEERDPGSLHRYVYTRNNPIRLIDISGFCTETPQFRLSLLGYSLIEDSLPFKAGAVGGGQLLYGLGAKTLGVFLMTNPTLVAVSAIVIWWAFDVGFELEEERTVGPFVVHGSGNMNPETMLEEFAENFYREESALLLQSDDTDLTAYQRDGYVYNPYLRTNENNESTISIDEIHRQIENNQSDFLIQGDEGNGYIINGRYYESLPN